MTNNQQTGNNKAETIAKLNELYISTRRKYIVQTSEAYLMLSRDNDPKYWALNDGMLKRHLDGKNTYGVFNANVYNKFITFDVDYAEDEAGAKWATRRLIAILQTNYNIRANDIHVSLSGSKGYHIDLFFGENITVEQAKSFYNMVRKDVGVSESEMEFRPSWGQAVKIPLGIHLKTGRRCWFVDRETLEPIESFEYLNDVEPMDSALILDALIELTDEQEAEFERVVRETDTSITVVNESKAFAKVSAILEAGQLLQSGTRHNTTVLLASFFNSQGWEREDAVEAIMEILQNTPPEYFSGDLKASKWLAEVERIVGYAFDRGYKLGNDDRPITIYKSEILAVLDVGTFRQKQVAYAMLITSKRYGKAFYLTMTTIMKMIGTKARDTVNKAIQKLVRVGFIEYVRKGEIDRGQSLQKGHPVYKPNRYRILIAKPEPGENSIEVTPNAPLIEVTTALLDINDVRKTVTRKEFYNRWRPLYGA